MMGHNFERYSETVAYAARIHATQPRKGTDTPYLSHLLSVSALVMEYGGDDDQTIAGLLHDAIEDCGQDKEAEIRMLFGDHVASIVRGCTDGVPGEARNQSTWRSRKEYYLEQLRSASGDVQLVSACDKLHNARSIAADVAAGHNVFARFNQNRDQTFWYYDSLRAVFAGRLGESSGIVRELSSAVERMKAEPLHA